MSTQQEVVERALAYPYAVPATSFLLSGGDVRDASGLGLGEPPTAGRTPLLAYGSNAAPEVLARKLGETTRRAPVAALRATLSGFDVVYSAHISRFGSVPATLLASPGTETTVFVAYLTETQLKLISATEPNYELVELGGVSCKLEGGETLTEIAAYRSRHGCLTVEGSGVALAEIDARGRSLPTMSQRQVQRHVLSAVAPGRSLERFVAENAADPGIARSRTTALRQVTSPFQ